MSGKIKKKFLIVGFNFLMIVILFILFEGISSTAIFLYKLVNRVKEEKSFTMYDKELGWIALPNLYIKDMYGPGIYLETNSQHFRSSYEINMNKSADKVRIICSGDSYTFGHGVDNAHTWCQLLVSMDNRLETVNLGQVGYGIDQSYLWYKRNSNLFEHDIHIFAFITDDFNRMKRNSFLGYSKPYFELNDGVLLLKNNPVPKRLFHISKMIVVEQTLKELSIIKLFEKLFETKDNSSSKIRGSQSNTQTKEIVLKLFKDLEHINQIKKVSLFCYICPPDYGIMIGRIRNWRIGDSS